jgi:uncharacterized membrane protein
MLKIFLIVLSLVFLYNPALVLARESARTIAEVYEVDTQYADIFKTQHIKAIILEGEYTGRLVEIQHMPARYSIFDFNLEVGHRILIEAYLSARGRLEGKIIGIDREFYIVRFAFIFLIILLIIGGIKGLRSLVALVLTGFIIVSVLIPMILDGHTPLFATMISSVIVIVLGFLIINGFSRKSAAAILGTTGGMIFAALFAEFFSGLTSITGATDQEIIYYIAERGISVDFAGLFVSGVLIGSIGVTMDVSMSVTSFVFELKKRSPRIKYHQLVSSGMNVGKDMIATMVNTLVLAYAGASMPLFLLFVNIGMPVGYILNTEIISAEIIRSLSGSVALILTIPLTSLIAASMCDLRQKGRKVGYLNVSSL